MRVEAKLQGETMARDKSKEVKQRETMAREGLRDGQ